MASSWRWRRCWWWRWCSRSERKPRRRRRRKRWSRRWFLFLAVLSTRHRVGNIRRCHDRRGRDWRLRWCGRRSCSRSRTNWRQLEDSCRRSNARRMQARGCGVAWATRNCWNCYRWGCRYGIERRKFELAVCVVERDPWSRWRRWHERWWSELFGYSGQHNPDFVRIDHVHHHPQWTWDFECRRHSRWRRSGRQRRRLGSRRRVRFGSCDRDSPSDRRR